VICLEFHAFVHHGFITDVYPYPISWLCVYENPSSCVVINNRKLTFREQFILWKANNIHLRIPSNRDASTRLRYYGWNNHICAEQVSLLLRITSKKGEFQKCPMFILISNVVWKRLNIIKFKSIWSINHAYQVLLIYLFNQIQYCANLAFLDYSPFMCIHHKQC